MQPGVTLILGKSFTGKTARLLHELKKTPRVVLADPKCAQLASLPRWSHLWPEWNGDRFPSFAVPDFFEPHLDLESKFRVVIHTRTDFKKQLNAVCLLLRKVRNTVLAVDELALYCPAGTALMLPPDITQLVISGRHEGLSFVATIQRPCNVHETILSQATRMLVYRITDEADLDTMAHYLPRDFASALQFLPDHACIDWEDGREPFADYSLRGKLGGLLPAPASALVL